MARYFASAEERETVGCFLVFQEIGKLPREMKYLVTDRRVMEQLTQLE